MPELDLNGRRIAYRAAGAGPPAILLHCSSSHSGQWKPYIEAWADRYRLLAPDLHGYCHSDPLHEDGRPIYLHDAPIVGALPDAPGQARLADCARQTMPVEIWRGTASRASARAIAGHLAREIPGATLREAPGADHMAAGFEPGRFIGPIGDFLDRVTAREADHTRES